VIVKQPLTPLSSSGSTGRCSIPETPDVEPRRLWNTGCPPCAEHDIRENMKPRSRGAFCPSYAKNLDPPEIGGRRKGRVPARTRGPSREKIRAKARSPQVAAENTPAFPAQWFYGLYALSSASQCLIATIAARRPLEPARGLTPASGRRDHTISPSASAPLVSQHIRGPPHPRPAFVTIAIAPLRLGRDGEHIALILVSVNRKYF
jgi:hypothetical protein